MTNDHSENRRRYLALWFPWLASDRLLRGRIRNAASPEPKPDFCSDPVPVVLVEKAGNALRLAAVDPLAAEAGLGPGLTLADARARVPVLRTVIHRPEADEALLLQVLEDFDRFSPMIALDPPHGLVLDTTGCDHLLGGEAGLADAVQKRARRIGLHVRWALASTPQAARALARFGRGGLYASHATRQAIRALPVTALELAEKHTLGLHRAGLYRIGDLDDRPRAPMAARFGTDFPSRLARLLGEEDVRITPHRPPSPIVADRVFVEPIVSDADVERALGDLLADAIDRLDQAGLGGRAFEACFYTVDGRTRRIVVRTGQASRDTGALLRLFRERLAALATPLDPGFGFEQMRLSVPETQTLNPVQHDLDSHKTDGADFSGLIDRLTARLGPQAVLRMEPLGSHVPERATRLVPAAALSPNAPGVASRTGWPEMMPGDPPLRPLQIFDPPQPVETMAEVPDGSPLRFRWRRVLHEVALAEGPERISGEWWLNPQEKTRDYYRVEDRQGRRFWLFRHGLYGESDEPRWFIHGLFA